MDSNDYYRNLHQPPAYGRKIMRELFESGNAQDGLPGIQQTTENLIRDTDGLHFAIVKAPVFTHTIGETFSHTSGYYFLDDSFHVLPASASVTIPNADYVFLTTGGVITGSTDLNVHGMLLGVSHTGQAFTGIQNERKVSGTAWVDQHTEKQVFINTIYSANQTGTYSYTVSGYTDKAVVNNITGSTFYLISGYIVSGHIDYLDDNIDGNDKVITNLNIIRSDFITGYTGITGVWIYGENGRFSDLSGREVKGETGSFVKMGQNLNFNNYQISNISVLYSTGISGTNISGSSFTGSTARFGGITGVYFVGNGGSSSILITSGLFGYITGSYFTGLDTASNIIIATGVFSKITGTDISGGTIVATTYTGTTNAVLKISGISGTLISGVTGTFGYITAIPRVQETTYVEAYQGTGTLYEYTNDTGYPIEICMVAIADGGTKAVNAQIHNSGTNNYRIGGISAYYTPVGDNYSSFSFILKNGNKVIITGITYNLGSIQVYKTPLY